MTLTRLKSIIDDLYLRDSCNFDDWEVEIETSPNKVKDPSTINIDLANKIIVIKD